MYRRPTPNTSWCQSNNVTTKQRRWTEVVATVDIKTEVIETEVIEKEVVVGESGVENNVARDGDRG